MVPVAPGWGRLDARRGAGRASRPRGRSSTRAQRRVEVVLQPMHGALSEHRNGGTHSTLKCMN